MGVGCRGEGYVTVARALVGMSSQCVGRGYRMWQHISLQGAVPTLHRANPTRSDNFSQLCSNDTHKQIQLQTPEITVTPKNLILEVM